MRTLDKKQQIVTAFFFGLMSEKSGGSHHDSTASVLYFSSRVLVNFAGHLLHAGWVPDYLLSDCHGAVLQRKGALCVANMKGRACTHDSENSRTSLNYF